MEGRKATKGDSVSNSLKQANCEDIYEQAHLSLSSELL